MFDALKTANLDRVSGEEIVTLQNGLLQRHVRYAAEHSPFYRRMFAERGLEPASVNGISDLGLLPFTRKADLESCHGDFLCVAESEIADLCLTSGTTSTGSATMRRPRFGPRE